jgi:cytochrome c oxidase subunit II
MQALHDFFAKLLGLPVLAAETGKGVDELIIYIHLLMIALFIGWFGYFVYVLWRFRRGRNPKADHLGVRNHASNYIEGLVAVIEGVLLLFVAIPIWAKAVDKFPKEEESTVIQVVAQQFDWNVRYPGKDGKFGAQKMALATEANMFGIDPNSPEAKDDVTLLTEIHVVVNKPVIIYVSSKDVIHSFKVLALRVTQDAIPGMRIPLWFKPTQTGKYQINCAQLCGPAHYSMSRGMLTVESQEEFDKWIATKANAPAPVSLE